MENERRRETVYFKQSITGLLSHFTLNYLSRFQYVKRSNECTGWKENVLTQLWQLKPPPPPPPRAWPLHMQIPFTQDPLFIWWQVLANWQSEMCLIWIHNFYPLFAFLSPERRECESATRQAERNNNSSLPLPLFMSLYQVWGECKWINFLRTMCPSFDSHPHSHRSTFSTFQPKVTPPLDWHRR